ncbi:hypothetical protein BDR22DRAFT_882859 [Usnea florida]
MSTTAIQVTALVTGSYLSGVMSSLSLIAIPVFFDTITSAPQLVRAWERMYHHGHTALPTLSVGTLALWAYAASRRRNAGEPWRLCALAGITTVLMVPFTWLVMVPTNNELFGLAAAGEDLQGVTCADVRALVGSWAGMHLTRAAFPLAGAVLGAVATFG